MSADDSDSDIALWQASLAGVKPLQTQSRAAPAKSEPDLQRRREVEVQEVMTEAMYGEFEPEDFNTGDQTEFRRNGIAGNTLRKLRRGQFAIQAQLDLHGLTREKAHQALVDFFQQAQRRDWRCLKIIHGKGLRSPQGKPVLKARVEVFLQRNDAVLAYCSAPNWSGGHGAVLVLLRKQ